MMVRITFLKIVQKTLDDFASRRENGYSDHDEEDSLEDGKKETKDPQYDKKPAYDRNYYLLDMIHFVVFFQVTKKRA